MSAPLLEISDLRVGFPSRGGNYVDVVRGLSLSLHTGEIMGIVGESGSGKSMAMRAVMGLLPPNARVSGRVLFDGTEILSAPARRLRALRGSRISMVFQDPMTALNPVMTVGAQVFEVLRLHNPGMSRKTVADRARELLAEVAILDPERRLKQYPHEFSGGMRQRVVIAIALANRPELIIADEPTTALDVTVQAQILDTLKSLCQQHNTALALITHDLGVVAGAADTVSVMYAGEIVEQSDARSLFATPRHPYTRGLIGAVPLIEGPIRRLVDIGGTPPSPTMLPHGCAFANRCGFSEAACTVTHPDTRFFRGGTVACLRAEAVGETAMEALS